MITIPAPRTLYIIGFLICAGLIATALYFQHGLGMEPCPLCILQRVAVIAIGLILLAAAILNPAGLGRRLIGLLTLIAAVAGGATSGRHLWLQSLPEDEVPACGPGLEYMLDTFPLKETLDMILHGSGECAEVSWRLLGLSMPGWMLLIFIAFALFGLWIAIYIKPSRSNALL
jgi:disulfide bond formation protein DsbB